MKASVSSYSFGPYNQSLGILGVIDKAAELGFEGIEFVDFGFAEHTEEVARSARERAEKAGIEIVAYAVGADLINAANIEDEIARLRQQLQFASWLGAPKMRPDIGHRKVGAVTKMGYDDYIPMVSKACLEVTEYAEQLGIVTMTENHGYFSQDAARVERLINAVGHPNFGALVDVGNFMCADEDPTVSVGILAPYAKHIHVKDFFFKSGMETDPGTGWFQTRAGNYLRGTIIGHGDAKVAQSLRTVKKTGYDGFVSIEFEGLEDHLFGLQVGLENLKRFF